MAVVRYSPPTAAPSARVLAGDSRDDGKPRIALMSDDARKAALEAELARLAKLPSNSAYAVHRTAVARRALELLSKQRNEAEADELERLLGGLSL